MGISRGRALLLLGSAVSSIAAIILMNTGVLPLDPVSFFFFSFVLFLFALYRPGWAFLLFIGALPLEIINLAPVMFSEIMIRPYQWIAALLILAVTVRFFAGRLPFRLFHPRLFDSLPLLFVFGALVALVGAPVFSVALKQTFVVVSFVILYFLGRVFFRTFFDVKQALPFFLVSSSIVFGYALWQNLRQLAGKESFQIMAGRPNATFSEADWLGLFAVFVFGVGLTLFSRSFFFLLGPERTKKQDIWTVLTTASFLVTVDIILIITVARSAWLGTMVLMLVFLLGILFWDGSRIRLKTWRKTLLLSLSLAGVGFFSMGLVLLLHLSPFQFLNRIQSTGSGLQKITIACDSADTVLPQKVTMADLGQNNCRFILLENIEQEKKIGKFVREVYRDDPNISIRRETYGRVLDILRGHALFGIGWGNIVSFLGHDERGAGLNASNVFLEVWLGSGFIGMIAFVVWWTLIAFASGMWFWKATEAEERFFSLFLLATLAGVTVFDFFNSGILLGFFFIFLSLGALAVEKCEIDLLTKNDTL